MSNLIEYMLKDLREAREHKGLTQRELSNKSGVPQSHISKIESGNVDVRISSLISLARALDIELLLVPKKSLSAVKAIITITQNNSEIQNKPAYSLEDEPDD